MAEQCGEVAHQGKATCSPETWDKSLEMRYMSTINMNMMVEAMQSERESRIKKLK